MVPQLPSASANSPRHEQVANFSEMEVPHMLEVAWSKCTPSDKPLSEQLNAQEKTFLILIAQYIRSALDSPLSASEPATVLSDILMTTKHRLSLLSKEVTFSPGYVVIATLLQLLTNLFAADNMKYTTMEGFLEVYPMFRERSITEQEKLFNSANWMHILFQITTAKKNKGLVMTIIPKFVEGNGAQYVTGSGQTQPTRDRVTVYETEGNVKPIKRMHRKHKLEGEDSESALKAAKKTMKKKPTHVKRKIIDDTSPVVVQVKAGSVRQTHSPTVQFEAGEEQGQHEQEYEEDHGDGMDLHLGVDSASSGSSHSQQQYIPMPPHTFNMPPPMPARRSESTFSRAAAHITSMNQSSECTGTSSYVKSPREFYLDVEANGTLRKSSSACWGSLTSVNSYAWMGGSEAGQFPDCQDTLQMLREASADSDFSSSQSDPLLDDVTCGACVDTQANQLLPPHLVHQQSFTFNVLNTMPAAVSGLDSALGSPNPQPRSLERCPTASLEEHDEVDLDLLEEVSRHAPMSRSWSWLSLSRSTSASSLTGEGGRDSVPTVVAN